MKTLNFFTSCNNLQEVKKKYKELAMLHHPDRGGNTTTMQEINAEYEYVCKNEIFDVEDFKNNYQDFSKFRDILDRIINFNITIEICGDWIWCSGNTYKYKTVLKDCEFKFSKNKIAWYWHAPGYQKRTKRKFSMFDIRLMWGSSIIDNSARPSLTGC